MSQTEYIANLEHLAQRVREMFLSEENAKKYGTPRHWENYRRDKANAKRLAEELRGKGKGVRA